ncbi:MAG: hypothetical protein H7Z19_14720 [Chitinophagaceae bacterium]|nr:hypothetical protein [Rubrivivax sp.]
MAAILTVIAAAPVSEVSLMIVRLISVGMAVGALAVLVGTRARHPGWLAVSVVAILIKLGR